MSYAQWVDAVECWTLAELRCDVPPNDDMLALMEAVGLDVWERYVTRFERSLKSNPRGR